MKNSNLILINQGSDARSAWADVAIRGARLVVSPELAGRLLERYPSLALHACKTSSFGDRLVGALLPHALEHLAIDLLVAKHPGEVFAGNTRWLRREEQTMRIRISLPKEGGSAPVERAFSEALLQLNGLMADIPRQID